MIWIPAHRDHAATLELIPRRATTILARPDGLPWRIDHFRHEFAKYRQLLYLSEITLHGLRKNAANQLAEAGCTGQGIAGDHGVENAADGPALHRTRGPKIARPVRRG